MSQSSPSHMSGRHRLGHYRDKGEGEDKKENENTNIGNIENTKAVSKVFVDMIQDDEDDGSVISDDIYIKPSETNPATVVDTRQAHAPITTGVSHTPPLIEMVHTPIVTTTVTRIPIQSSTDISTTDKVFVITVQYYYSSVPHILCTYIRYTLVRAVLNLELACANMQHARYILYLLFDE